MREILFFDLETAVVPWSDLSPEAQGLWSHFAARKYAGEELAQQEAWEALWLEKGALHAEFGRICCLSYAVGEDEPKSILSQYDEGNERGLLQRFSEELEKSRPYSLCAHNGKGFDFHYLARRYVIRKLPVPDLLRTMGKKPWEVNLLDTQEMWGFGDMRRTVSLEVLCMVLGVPSPKDAMTGAQVGEAWRSGDIVAIAEYCEKDVAALRECYKRLIHFAG